MVRFTDRPDMTIAVFRGRKTSNNNKYIFYDSMSVGYTFDLYLSLYQIWTKAIIRFGIYELFSKQNLNVNADANPQH